jgi:hypothetical protein
MFHSGNWHRSSATSSSTRRQRAQKIGRATRQVVEQLELRRLLAVISVDDVTATEPIDGGNNVARFTVRLNAPATSTVTVNYSAVQSVIPALPSGSKANPIVLPVAATLGSDFTATSGLLTFTAGQQTKTVDVPVLPDTLRENDEFFELRLSNPNSSNTIGDVSGQAHIPLNDLGTVLSGYFSVTLSELTDLTSRAFETIRNGITGAMENVALPLVGGDLDKHLEPILTRLGVEPQRPDRKHLRQRRPRAGSADDGPAAGRAVQHLRPGGLERPQRRPGPRQRHLAIRRSPHLRRQRRQHQLPAVRHEPRPARGDRRAAGPLGRRPARPWR